MELIKSPSVRAWNVDFDALGFSFYSVEGIPEWSEDTYVKFSNLEIENIKASAELIHSLALNAAKDVDSLKLYPLLGMDDTSALLIGSSIFDEERDVCGKIVLSYDGVLPKLVEYQADNPSHLFEAAICQWNWLEKVFPEAKQFNSIHTSLVSRWKSFLVGKRSVDPLYVTTATPVPVNETVAMYMGVCADEAGFDVRWIPIQDIGWNGESFTDLDENTINLVYKAYPWHWLLVDKFGLNIDNSDSTWMEPSWKMLLSNRSLLSHMWEMYPEHPNLIHTVNNMTLVGPSIKKPYFDNWAGNGSVSQAFDNTNTLIDAWIVNGQCVGIGVRENNKFLPHIVE